MNFAELSTRDPVVQKRTHVHQLGRYVGVQSFIGLPDFHLYQCAICGSTMTGPAPESARVSVGGAR